LSRIDLKNLLKEISPEAPSGENASSNDLFELSQNTEIKKDPNGKVLSKPNWKDVHKAALELLGKTHDFRIAVILARASIAVQGFAGLYDALRLIRGFVEEYWDTVYPLLDVENNNDPTQRISVLWEINDENRFISPIMRIPLCHSTKMGRYGLRHIYIANKTLKSVTKAEDEGQEKSEMKVIEAAFKDTDPETLRKTQSDVDNVLKEVKTLKRILDEKVGSDNSVKFDELVKVLNNIGKIMADRVGKIPNVSGAENEDENSTVLEPAQPLPVGVSMNPATISGRRDILRMLDLICEYYAENEPASPVPLLLKRAGRLVEKNFIEILEDIAPDGVNQIQNLVGAFPEPEKEKSK